MSFSALGLADPLVRAVTERGYTEPTPIQRQAIPAVLTGIDLLAGAQTGTGKTAGFTLPILQRLIAAPKAAKPGKVRVLVLVPTRELAAQVEESVRHYGKYTAVTSLVIFGGVGINPQIAALRKPVDILVATPGRLLDHVAQKTVDLGALEILVLDEADRMLDMGFIRDIRKILALLPPKRQNLLFSATFPDEIKALADDLLDNPALVEVARTGTTAELIQQRIYTVNKDQKRALLSHLIQEHNWHQVLVFTRTKHGADRLAKQLNTDGITALAIHGNKSQNARTRTLGEFKSGELQVLVATDIAARGIDIAELPHVVNYELPNVPEDYVHRIGRTGRAGAEGEAISLVCVDELKLLADIERLLKRRIPASTLEGFDWDPNATPEPIQNGRGQKQGAGRGAPRSPTAAPAGEAKPAGATRGRDEQGKRGEGRGAAAGRNEGNKALAKRNEGNSASAKSGERRDGGQRNEARNGGRSGGHNGENRSGDARGNEGRNGQRRKAEGQGGQGSKGPRTGGEVNGNVPERVRPEVDGNRIPAPKPDVNGNVAAPNPKGLARRAVNAVASLLGGNRRNGGR